MAFYSRRRMKYLMFMLAILGILHIFGMVHTRHTYMNFKILSKSQLDWRNTLEGSSTFQLNKLESSSLGGNYSTLDKLIPMKLAEVKDSEPSQHNYNEDFIKMLPINTEQEYDRWYKQHTANFPQDLINSKPKFQDDKSCAKFPTLLDLNFNNVYWQSLTTNNKGVAYLLSAYYDNRNLVKNKPIIKIIAIIEEVDLPSVKHCQIWFEDEKKLVRSKVSSPIFMEVYPYHMHAYVLSCEIPKVYNNHVPAAVSLVENDCDLATNVLKVNYNLPNNVYKEDFAICIKGMTYPTLDLSFYLVEYLELAKILGVSKLYIYDFDSHPNMSLVLRYYENQDLVQRIPLTFPGARPTLHGVMHDFIKAHRFDKLTFERLAHNDCFYRNIHRYKYIGFFDIDEIMIPYKGKTWKQLIDGIIEKEKKNQGSTYRPPSAYLFPAAIHTNSMREPHGWNPEIPKYMSMLQNVYRSRTTHGYTKQLIDTERNLGISNHRPVQCIGDCIKQRVQTDEGYIAHFRFKCSGACRVETKDTNIWNYKEKLIENVEKSLMRIGLL